jgi:Mlc titration factor MtfA (ptsG expression regulator)
MGLWKAFQEWLDQSGWSADPIPDQVPPLPAELAGPIEKHLGFYRELTPELRRAFDHLLPRFLGRIDFYGAPGFEVTDEMRAVIGGAAVRLVLRLGLRHYERLTEVVVHPADYLWPDREEPLSGEAQEWGSVVLSWDAVLEGFDDPESGVNTAYHEFAHALDRATGEFDGTPNLHRRSDYADWTRVMTREFEALRKGKRRSLRVLDDYGAESSAEFFAVATEAFFSWPEVLEEELPELYGILAKFFRQDPAREWT